jgi:hypothetical protein
VARLLNDTFDPDNSRHIVRLMDSFAAHNHLCLVFELLSINIYELLKTNQFRGLPLPMIRSFTKQVRVTTPLIQCIHYTLNILRLIHMVFAQDTTAMQPAATYDTAVHQAGTHRTLYCKVVLDLRDSHVRCSHCCPCSARKANGT